MAGIDVFLFSILNDFLVGLFFLVFFEYFLRPKDVPLKHRLGFYGLGLLAVYLLFRNNLSLANLGGVILLLLYATSFYKDSFILKVLCFLIIGTMQYLSEITLLIILASTKNQVYLQYYAQSHKEYELFSGITACLILIGFHWAVKKKFFPKRIYLHGLSRTHRVILLAVLFILQFFSYLSDVSLEANQNIAINLSTSFLLTTILMLIMTITVVVTLIYKQNKNGQLEYQSKILENQLAMQMLHYETIEKNYSEVRRTKHDLLNHLICLEDLIKNQEIQQALNYIHDLQGSLTTAEKHQITGNSIADAILSDKKARFSDFGCSLHFEGQLPTHQFIDPRALCIVISNSLDNAYEATAQVETPEERIISMKSYVRQNHWVYMIENPHNNPQIDKDKLHTTKEDTSTHGLGFKSILSIVEDLNGHTDVTATPTTFKLEVVIPTT